MTPATGEGLVECHLETSVSSCLQWLSAVRPSIALFLWISSSRCTTEPDEKELMSLLTSQLLLTLLDKHNLLSNILISLSLETKSNLEINTSTGRNRAKI